MSGALQRAEAECAARLTSVFIKAVSALLDELRAKAYAAMSRSPPIKVDNLNDDVYKAQEVYDTSVSALRTRLQSVQDEIYNMIADVEADESRLSALRNALGDLMEISNWKRDSILSQARARELQPADAVPFGAWSIAYDRDGCRLLGQIKAPPPRQAAEPAYASSQFTAQAYPLQGDPYAHTHQGASYAQPSPYTPTPAYPQQYQGGPYAQPNQGAPYAQAYPAYPPPQAGAPGYYPPPPQ